MEVGKFLKVSPEFWFKVQMDYDKVMLARKLGDTLDKIMPYDKLPVSSFYKT